MDLKLKGKTALITGGSKGIGAGTARVLAAEGVDLILVARNADALESTRAEIAKTSSSRIQTRVCDVSNSEDLALLAEHHPDVDILVNNAGAVPGGSLLDVSEAQWRAGWDSKVFAYVNLCRLYYPLMKKRGGGVIVNVSGIGARTKSWDYLCGGMGNAALDFLTETMGANSPVDNIRVVGVSPGPVATERWFKIRQNHMQGTESQPFGRHATPEEIGNAIAMLASERSAYTSGLVYVVDGGKSISKQWERSAKT